MFDTDIIQIWEKIKIAIQALIDFIGFLFAWSDILDTKNTISATITAGLGYAGTKVDSLITKSDAFFDDLSRTVDALGDSISTSKRIGTDDADRDSKSKEAESSTTVSWAQERLKNGGAGTQSKADLKGMSTRPLFTRTKCFRRPEKL